MRWFNKFVSEVMNLKLHTTLPPSIRSQEKWKFCIWHCPIIVRTVPKSTKMTIFIAILLGAYSSNGIGGTPLQIISGSSLQEDVLFLVLIDNCVVLLVNVYAVFIVHGGLTLITLKNKKITLPLWILEEHSSVLSYVTSILVQKSVLIIWPWDCYQLTGLVSNFFRNFFNLEI